MTLPMWALVLAAEVPASQTAKDAYVLAVIGMMGVVLAAALPAYFAYRARATAQATQAEVRGVRQEISTDHGPRAGQLIEELAVSLARLEMMQRVTQAQVNALATHIADLQVSDAVQDQTIRATAVIRRTNQEGTP